MPCLQSRAFHLLILLAMHFETQALQAGYSLDPITGALVSPIHLSTTFERQADGSYPGGYVSWTYR
jgi:hypothetical protein